MSLPRFSSALACSVFVLTIVPGAGSVFAQTSLSSRPVITLEKPVGDANAEAATSAVSAPKELGEVKSTSARGNYREFSRAKIGDRSSAETLTFIFHETTKLTAISTKGDFEVTGGSCGEGHTYIGGEKCSVDLVFKPEGPGKRSGSVAIAHTASATPMLTPIGGTAYGPVVSFIPAQISTLPGTLSGSNGTLANPGGLAVDGGDDLWIADTGNHLIKFRDSSGALLTKVGGGATSLLSSGSGFGSQVKLNAPSGVVTDYTGTLYFTDAGDKIVGSYYIDNIAVRSVGGGATNANTCTPMASCTSPSNVFVGPPVSIAADSSGNVYLSLLYGSGLPGASLAEWTPDANTNVFYDLGTTAYNFYSSSTPVTVDPFGYGNLYYPYTDPGGPILSPTPLCYILGQNYAYSQETTGERFWTVAGSSQCGFSGDGGKATGAEISKTISAFAWDAAGSFYFTDTGNNRVRRVDVNGIIHTIAGNGGNGFGGDGGPATNANVQNPVGLAVDSFGRVYTTGVAGTGKADVRVVSEFGALSFPSQLISTHSSVETVLVTNTGNAVLNFSKAYISTGNNSDFAIDQNTSTCNTAVPMASGKSCTIGIQFTPSGTGSRSSELIILDDTVTGSNIVKLSGSGATAAKATLTPGTEAFGSEKVGTASAAKVLTLANAGGLNLSISSITLTGSAAADFSQTHSCGSNLGGNSSCTISVVFKPVAAGAGTATLTVVTNGGTVTAALSGTGTTAAVATPIRACCGIARR